jgi:hypothetical protein
MLRTLSGQRRGGGGGGGARSWNSLRRTWLTAALTVQEATSRFQLALRAAEMRTSRMAALAARCLASTVALKSASSARAAATAGVSTTATAESGSRSADACASDM